MEKITTLFKKDPNDLSRVINEVNEENSWVFNQKTLASLKFDGTSCAIINGKLYRRYDAKKGKQAPIGAIPCQEPDLITGHHPHWILCERDKSSDKYHFEAFDLLKYKQDGTYELCGEKIQGNPEKIKGHELLKHGSEFSINRDWSFNSAKNWLENHDYEGIVFHNLQDGRMCKLRKSDFGLQRK